MFSLVCDPLQIDDLETVDVELEAEGMDLLLAAWLNELLYIFEARQPRALPVRHPRSRRAVAARPRRRRAALGRHILCGGVKAATLHELSLERRDDGWQGFVLLDV